MFSRFVARRGGMPQRGLPLLILLIAFALRLFRLDAQSFDADEFLSVWHTVVPLDTLFRALPVDHTPAYWVSLHYWISAVGDVDFSIRILSVFWGVLSVALLIPLGARLISRPVGLLAAFILALDPFAIYYSQEARMYTMLLALSAVSVYTFARAFERPRSRLRWLWHGLALAAALYTHYYAFALVVGEFTFLFLERKRWSRARWLGWTSSVVLLVVLFFPWVPHLVRLLQIHPWQPPVDPLTYPAEAWTALFAGSTVSPNLFSLAVIASNILMALGIAVTRTRWQGRLLSLSYFAPLAIVVVGLTLRGSGPLSRYFVVLMPAAILLAAAAIERARSRTLGRVPVAAAGLAAAYLALCGLSLANYWFDSHYSRPDWRAAAAWIQSHEQAGDLVLIDGADKIGPFDRYYHGASRFEQAPALRKSGSNLDAEMARTVGSAPRVWLILFDREPGQAEDWIDRHAFFGDYEEFAGVYVWPAIVKANLSTASQPRDMTAQGGVTLRSYRAANACAGGWLPVALEWQNGPERQSESLQVSLRLVARPGNVLSAMDRAPRFGLYPTTAWLPGQVVADNYALPLPDNLSPGEYDLAAILYSPADGEPVLTADLGRVQVCEARARGGKS